MSPTPGSYSKVTEERQVATLAPQGFMGAAIYEARKTVVPMSLLVIVALVVGAYYAGRSAPPQELVAQIATIAERATASQATIAEQTRQNTETQKQVLQLLQDIRQNGQTMNTEVQFMSSYFKAGKAP